MPSLVLFLSCALLAQAAESKTAPVQILFSGEKWYQEAPGMPQAFEGVLDWNRGQGRIGLPKRFVAFQLQFREADKPVTRPVFTNGKDFLLAPFAGRQVRLTAKAVETESNGNKVTELWPAQIEDLGAGSIKTEVEAPILARFDTWPYAPVKLPEKVETTVLRDAKSAAQFFGYSGSMIETKATNELTKQFDNVTVDWSKHIVVVVRGGIVKGYEKSKIEFVRILVEGGGLVIAWKNSPQGPSAKDGMSFPSATILVPKCDGEVRFNQQGKP